MSKVHRVRRLALGCALALVGAAFAPGPPLCLLDWVVVHAHRAEGPLLVEAGLAAELQRLRPADPPTEVRRAELEAWLYTAGAALTSTPSGGWIVYRPGSVLARALLQRQAPWVEVDELARRGQDIVWIIDPPDVGESSIDELVEVRLGDHRVVGGPAHLIRAATRPPDPAELIPADGPPLLPGVTLGQWTAAFEAGDGQRFASGARSELLDDYVVWNVDGAEGAHRLGIATSSRAGPYHHLEVELDRLEPRSHQGRWGGAVLLVRDLSDLVDLPPFAMVTTTVQLDHLDARQTAWTLERAELGPLVMASAGFNGALILTGRAVSVRAWWGILERLDH